MRFGRILFLIIILLCAFEIVRLWSIAPAQVAVHFNAAGNPDRFATKDELFWDQVKTLLIVVAVSLPPQVLFLILPPGWINLPNRDYWFSPERSNQTRETLSEFGAFMFSIILLAVQAVFEISVYANLQTPVRFNVNLMFLIMALAFITILWMLVNLARSFRPPKRE